MTKPAVGRMAGRVVLVSALALVGVFPVRSIWAQSLTTGRIEGVVVDEAGVPVVGAVVTVQGQETSVEWTLRADRTGRFVVPLVEPGVYDVRAEDLGFNPVVVQSVVVRAGEGPNLRISLRGAAPGAITIDSMVHGGGAGASPSSAVWISPSEIRRYPGDRAVIGDLSRLVSESGDRLRADGLPARLTGLAFDGVPYRRATHSSLNPEGQEASYLPRSSVAHADYVHGGVDVEWGEFAGALLAGYSPAGGNVLRSSGYVDWSGGPMARSDVFAPEDVSHMQARGGVTVAGPIVADTAHFVIGLEARRIETPFAAPWSESPFGSDVAEIADAADADIADYLDPGLQQETVVGGFGRVNWRFSPRTLLTVRAGAASTKIDDPLLGAGRSASLGSTMDALEVQAAVGLSAVISPMVSQELRVGFETSRAEYTGVGVPTTMVADGRTLFGDDPAVPGEFRRTGVRLSETLHIAAGAHRVKLGVNAQFTANEQRYLPLPSGAFAYANATAFEMGQGTFRQWTGSGFSTSFSSIQFGGALQDVVRVADGVALSVGLRVDGERRPVDDILLNSEWADLTGLENTAMDAFGAKVSPRIGISWRLDPAGSWFVRGEAGRYHDVLGAELMGELIANAGDRVVRRAAGDLGAWPNVPGGGVPDTEAPSLTLPGPDLASPASLRAAAGITGSVGAGVGLRLVGAYRHTDFLIRRHDVNRRTVASTDQYGRPVFGTLQQLGGLLAATPGTNRRFGSFDLVSALDPDGYSDRYSLSLGLERPLGDGLTFTAQYTFSRTEDNVAWGTGLAPDDELSPFPDSLDGQDWLDGRSDFDVPHRVVFGMEVPVPGVPVVRLAGLYRFRSGLPFTPGFRDGVDANADGSGRNDPAFVDGDLEGIDELLAAWPCLRPHAGSFVERNACRGPASHVLDIRLSVRVASIGGGPAEIVAELINVFETDAIEVDRALYLVDEDAVLTVDPVDDRVVVPLVVNQDFGSTLRQRSLGRRARIGLRINW